MGLFSNNERVFTDGFQIVVNLSKRLLTPAETSVYLRVSLFAPHRGILIFLHLAKTFQIMRDVYV